MMCFEGSLSVKATLLAGRREVSEIWVDEKKKDKDTSFIIHQAKQRNVPVLFKKREAIDEVATGKTHGGIVAFASNRTMQTLQDCLNYPLPFIVILEGIEDPFNLGYALRTLYAAGCTGVLLSPRDWTRSENVIVKSSAGASEYINCCFVEDLSDACEKCKKAGLRIFCAMRKDAVDYYQADFNQPLVLAIGGEMRGLSKAVLQQSDQNIFVPYANDFKNALNASSATAAISFEVVRQRGV